MSEQQRLQQEIEALQQSLTELDEKIAPIRARRAVERIDEQLRLDEIIRADEAERDRVENQLRTSEAKLESLNTSAQKAELVTEARRRERNQAYAEAIHTWETIRALTPDDLYIEPEIQRLQALQGHKASFTELIKDVSGRMLDIRPVFAQVVKRLRQMSEPGGEDPAIQTLVENFLNHAIAPAEFIEMWQSLSQEVQPAEPELNYRALVERIKRGEIALYLGSDIPELFDATVKNERQIVSDLAQKAAYEDFNGSLSMMAEYYRMKPEYGQPSLVRNLRDVLPQGTTEVPLYDLLAKVEQPLVLISAAYDTLMERVFLRAGKKFVLVTSLIGMNPEAEVGKVRFQYSDREGAEEPCLEDQLSHLDVLGNGYSLIYKIRGYLGDQEENMRQQQHGLTLTEEDHFTFARYMDRLIPNYVVRQLQSRGFVFLGYAPKKWEDRLIANALLYKRRQVEEPAYAVQHELDRFEEIYWDRHNVRRHVIELGAFVRKLEENFA